MQMTERVCVYAVLAAALALGVRGGGQFGSAAQAQQGGAADGGSRLAVCSLGAIVDEMMETERYLPQRLEFEEELRSERLDEILERMEALEGQVEQFDPGGGEFQAAREEYFRLRGAAERLQLEIRRQVEAKVCEQLIDIRGQVLASARAVAEDLGYDYVIASEDDEQEFERESVRDLVIDFLSRPVLLAPEEADITEDVREDLNLD